MPIIREIAQRYLKDFNFKSLFTQQLGWNNYNARPLYITLNDQTYTLRSVVEKRGMVVYVCEPTSDGSIPLSPIRRKIEKEVTKITYEHIIIYIDAQREHQVWQWMRREPRKPTASREIPFSKNQTGEALLQKLPGIAFDLSQEEHLTTSYVTSSVRRAFDVDRVTKRFYDRFQAEHATFLKFIEGIPTKGNREWYASLMLNRLMFVYFIQKKGFLDNNEHYLRDRLRAVQQRKGDGNFLNFYRHFLLRLFHEGLGKQEHSAKLEALLGKVPYLNGGLFDVHELERANQHIQIADEAFEKLFDFFDAYQWHLDEHPLRADNEINPDVLGYIFEKYINQKQMGAYYTKEDITEYISKSTIVPFLFDAAKNKCSIAFEPCSTTWQLLQENPDFYINEALKKGVRLPLPTEIAVGLNDVSQRTEWNKPAPEEYALPTEIWREVVARRKRYEEVHTKLAAGEIHSINDLITYNLDIRQFVQDVIENCDGPDLLRAFYQSIERVTVLDPTCGSGAFLFAALNILEPLYEACLDRMEAIVNDLDRLNEYTELHGRSLSQQRLPDFRATLNQIEHHPNRRYFILKSIIVNNLYGVDIMEEATEICKLRLFLKLVAQIEHKEDIEPLPDIDFNIRAGNTLVGFATYEEVRKSILGEERGKGERHGEIAFQNQIIFDNVLERIDQKAQEVERGFENFRKLQTQLDLEASVMAKMKQQLRIQLKELNAELDRYLAREYGIDFNNISKRKDYEEKFEQWEQNHQPFHWFVEFYGIMKNGGFDVIIGNPPYVEYSKVRNSYKLLPHTYRTEVCGNLYAFVLERSIALLINSGRQGLIVPISLVCTQRMAELQNIIKATSGFNWHSNYAERPAKLFSGAEVLLTISLLEKGTGNDGSHWTTGLRKWNTVERVVLFDLTMYEGVSERIRPYILPKISSKLELSIIEKVWRSKKNLGFSLLDRKGNKIFYRIGGGRYWKVFTTFQPRFILNGEQSVSSRENYLYFKTIEERDMAVALLSSTLFYWYFILTTNGRDLNPSDLKEFPISLSDIKEQERYQLIMLTNQLMDDYRLHKREKKKVSALTGNITYEEFYPRESKPIIDEIDRILAQHYNFTDQELDFIINYDIKYRIGRDEEGEE